MTCSDQVSYTDSLGLLHERVTESVGFLSSSDKYKVMALASFGRHVYRDDLRRLIRLTGDGHYTVAPLRLEERFGSARLQDHFVSSLIRSRAVRPVHRPAPL